MAANRVVWLGLAAAILTVAGLVAVVAHDGGDDTRTEAAIDGDPPVTTSTPPPLSTTTEPPLATTTTPPATSTPPSTTGRSTTTRAPRTTVAPVTTSRPATTSTTTTGQPLCAVEQIELTASTDNTRATAGRPVTITSSIRNQSQSSCFYRGYTFTTEFRKLDGPTLTSSVVHADDTAPRPFAPGQRLTHSATWDQTVCPHPPCGSGIYEAIAVWSFSGGRYQALRQFVIP